MTKSIMQPDDKECWITKRTTGLHKHHCYGGANRKLSEKYGCFIWLVPELHNMSNAGVHFNRELDLLVKRTCQRKFMEVYPDLDFLKIFGRNYLEEYE